MPSVTTLSVPFAKQVQVKSFAVTRSMTAGTDKAFMLPRGSRILGYILSGTASDAGTSATLSVGTTSGTPVEHVNALDVKTAATGSGVGVLRGVTGAHQAKLTTDTMIFVKVTEVGTASTVGSWTLTVVYTAAGMNGAGTE
jgi:hypothetical protein